MNNQTMRLHFFGAPGTFRGLKSNNNVTID